MDNVRKSLKFEMSRPPNTLRSDPYSLPLSKATDHKHFLIQSPHRAYSRQVDMDNNSRRFHEFPTSHQPVMLRCGPYSQPLPEAIDHMHFFSAQIVPDPDGWTWITVRGYNRYYIPTSHRTVTLRSSPL